MKEKVNIEFEDLFVNLLIVFRRSDIKLDKVSYSLIDTYATTLLNYLTKKDIGVNFKLDNENIDTFLKENATYYEDSKTEGSILILKQMPIDKMILKHRFYLSSSLKEAMYSDEVITNTLEAYIDELVKSKENDINKVKDKIKDIKENK